MSNRSTTKRTFAAILATCMLFSCVNIPVFAQSEPEQTAILSSAPPAYLNTELSFEERAVDLVSRMTLEEKASQLQNGASAIPRLGVKGYEWWSEALHGVARQGAATSFPTSLAMASTWNRDMAFAAADATSTEARGFTDKTGRGLSYWSPTINLARDARWGRNDETYGEDPYLTTEFGKEFVNGMQGDDDKYLKTISTVKHFAANNSEFNRHTGTSDMDDRDLREYYTYTFKNVVEDAKVESVMSSYNRINGVPASANTYLLDTLLRQTWGFDGYVVSDCGAINDIVSGHHWKPEGWDREVTRAEATAFSLLAGTDLNCGGQYRSNSIAAINQGLMSEDDLDQNLVRLFTSRMRTGEFDPAADVPYTAIKKDVIEAPAHAQIALESAQESVIMLKNENPQGGTAPALPIDASKVNNVALIGALGNAVELGGYSGSPSHTTTPLAGITAELKAKNPAATITYKEGIPNSGSSASYVCNFNRFDVVTDNGKTAVASSKYSQLNGLRDEDGKNLGYISNNAWAKYSNVNMEGAKSITVSISAPSEAAPGTVEVHYGALDGPIVAQIPIQRTGNWGTYQEFTAPYSQGGFNSASADLYFVFKTPLGEGIDPAAVEAARNADVAVVYVGTFLHDADEERDRNSLELPRNEASLVSAIAAVNPNTVVIIQSIGFVNIESFKNQVPTILWNCYNGQAQGEAIADVLFGDVNPSAKLTYTWFKNEADMGSIGDYNLRGSDKTNGKTYLYFDGDASYPFGHGLSYTNFTYSDMKLSKNSVNPNEQITVNVTVTNTGSIAGKEVVELYVKSPEGIPDRPAKRLKGFEKTALLAPGASETISIPVDVADFYFWDMEAKKEVVDNGVYTIEIGASSTDIRHTAPLTVTGELDSWLKVVTARPDAISLSTAEPDKTIATELSAVMNDETFYDISKAKVEYSSNRPHVAAVDQNGVVTAAGGGTALITATVTIGDKTVSDSYAVTVADEFALDSIQIDGTALDGFTPQTYNYSVAVEETDTIPQVSATAKEGVTVSVEQATALPGQAVITATKGESNLTYTIYFGIAPKSTDFTQGVGDNWSIVRENKAKWTQDAAGLTISTENGDLYQATNNAKNIFVQEAAGDWLAETKLTFNPMPSKAYHQGGLLAYQDDDNWVKIDYEAVGGKSVQFAYELGGTFHSVSTKVENTLPDNTIYFRLLKEGDTYEGFYSLNGVDYISVGKRTQALFAPKLALMAVDAASGLPSINVTYQYLNIYNDYNPELASIEIDGEAFTFDPNTSFYSVAVKSDTVPLVTATATEGYKVDIVQAEAIPGIAEITVSSDTGMFRKYRINFGYAPKSDNFLNAKMGSQWTILSENETAWGLEQGKGLRLDTLAGDIFEHTYGNAASNIVVQPAAGDFEVVTKIDFSKVPYQNFQNAALLVYSDDDNYVKMSYEYLAPSTAVQFGKEEKGAFTRTSQTAGAITGTTAYLKVVKKGNDYEGFYSMDGITYKSAGKLTSELVNPQIGLMAVKALDNSEVISAYYSYVGVTTSDEPALGYEAAMKDIDNVKGTAGTAVSIPVTLGKYQSDKAYRAIEGVVSIPDGLTFVDATEGETVLADSFEYNVDGDTLRFAYLNADTADSITSTSPDTASELLKLNFTIASDMEVGSKLSVAFDRLTAKTADEAYEYGIAKANSTITIGAGEIEKTALASELYVGNGEDIIPAGKKAVSVIFTGIDKDTAVAYGSTPFYYNEQRSERNSQIVYVAMIDESISLEAMSDVANYTFADSGVQTIEFGNGNDDTFINASDALMAVSAWLRKTEISEKQMLALNVSCDPVLDTKDAIDIVDKFLGTKEFAVVEK